MKLLKAKDTGKDQTYFLAQVSQQALRKTLFPVGDFMKDEVKQLARSCRLDKIANKREVSSLPSYTNGSNSSSSSSSNIAAAVI